MVESRVVETVAPSPLESCWPASMQRVFDGGLYVEVEHWALPLLRVDAELQVQLPLLEYLHSVAHAVVAAVLRGSESNPRCAHEPRTDSVGRTQPPCPGGSRRP